MTPENAAQLLANKFSRSDSCWIWRGRLNDSGYGVVDANRRVWRAHRLSLVAAGRDIPPGKMVDHTCRVRACVNPNHLRVVDARTNTIENSASIAALNARKTHCKRGHPYSPENTRITFSKGTPQRDCLTCARESKARITARLRLPPCPGHERHLFRGRDACVRCGQPAREVRR